MTRSFLSLVLVVVFSLALGVVAQDPMPAGDIHPAIKAWQKRRSETGWVEYTFRGTKTLHKSGPRRIQAAKQSTMYSVRTEDIVLNSSATLSIDASTGQYRLEWEGEEYDAGMKLKKQVNRTWTYDGQIRRGKQTPSGSSTGDQFTEADVSITNDMALPDLVKLILPDLGVVPLRNDLPLNHTFIRTYSMKDDSDLLVVERGVGLPQDQVRFSLTTKQPEATSASVQKIDIQASGAYAVTRIARYSGQNLRRELTYRYVQNPAVLKSITDRIYFEPSEVDSTETYEIQKSSLTGPVQTDLTPEPGSSAVKLSQLSPAGHKERVRVERYQIAEDGKWNPVDSSSESGKSIWPILVLLALMLTLGYLIWSLNHKRRAGAA